jgi:hypothetical protein
MAEERDPTLASAQDPVEQWQSLPEHERLALVELVNRVLDKGVVVTGEVTISIGGVDLLFVGLQLVLSSIDKLYNTPGVSARALGPPRR